MKRIWSVRINLDEFNSLFGMAFSEREKAEMLVGLSAGLNNAVIPEQCSNGVRAAFEIGSKWRGEAEGFQSRQSRAGHKSAAERKLKFGTAQPPNGVRADLEQSSNLTLNHNPLTVQPEKAALPSRARKAKKEKLPIPEEYLKDLQVICNDWPRRSKKQEGGYQDLRVWSDPADLWEAMTKNFPNDDPALMIKCGLVYLDQILPEPSEFDLREPEPPSFCYAMMNFYGPKMAYWKLKKEAARAKMEEQK